MTDNMTVKQWLERDRQWPHHLRIEHAKYQIRINRGDKEKQDFWLAVLQANEDGHHA